MGLILSSTPCLLRTCKCIMRHRGVHSLVETACHGFVSSTSKATHHASCHGP